MITTSPTSGYSQITPFTFSVDGSYTNTRWDLANESIINDDTSVSHVFSTHGWNRICFTGCRDNEEITSCSSIWVDSSVPEKIELENGSTIVEPGRKTELFYINLSSSCPPPHMVDLVVSGVDTCSINDVGQELWSGVIPNHGFFDSLGNSITNLNIPTVPILSGDSILGYEGTACFTFKDSLFGSPVVFANYTPICEVCPSIREPDFEDTILVVSAETPDSIYPNMVYVPPISSDPIQDLFENSSCLIFNPIICEYNQEIVLPGDEGPALVPTSTLANGAFRWWDFGDNTEGFVDRIALKELVVSVGTVPQVPGNHSGSPGLAAYFNGQAALSESAQSSDDISRGEITIGFWVKLDNSPVSNFNHFIEKPGNFRLRYSRTNQIYRTSFVDAGNGNNSFDIPGFTPIDGVWYMLMYTVQDFSTFFRVSVYRDGNPTPLGSRDIDPDFNTDLDRALNVGYFPTATIPTQSGLVGAMDTLAIWNRVLTLSERQEFYNDGNSLRYDDLFL